MKCDEVLICKRMLFLTPRKFNIFLSVKILFKGQTLRREYYGFGAYIIIFEFVGECKYQENENFGGFLFPWAILEVVLTDGKCWYDLIVSMPQLHQNDKWAATRTRCYDRASLETLLAWYVCSKFSPTDEKYIDTHTWTDVYLRNHEFSEHLHGKTLKYKLVSILTTGFMLLLFFLT